MSTEQTNPRITNIKFRVLVLGRANAGKTSILQRICDTTESPTIYRRPGEYGQKKEVRHGGPHLYASLVSLRTSLNLNRRWMLVIIVLLFVCSLTLSQRGEHTIDDELVFSNHTGYVFHDSRGIECGSIEELETLRKFIRRKCGGKKLQDKLHAIWFALQCS
jgi:GTPase SAR1 family protein